jgi:hypothetical protein
MIFKDTEVSNSLVKSTVIDIARYEQVTDPDEEEASPVTLNLVEQAT